MKLLFDQNLSHRLPAPTTVEEEVQRFVGLRAGLLAYGWQDNDIRGGLDVAFHAPCFQPWFVRTGWCDFGVTGLPIWMAALFVFFFRLVFRSFVPQHWMCASGKQDEVRADGQQRRDGAPENPGEDGA